MTGFWYRRRLRKLQNARDKIHRQSRLELKGNTGEKRHELQAQWNNEFFMIQEEIDECQSDEVRRQVERLDVSLPKCEEGEFWERMNYTGDRLILTTRGREETREKIQRKRKHAREAWGFYIGMAATIGSLLVAALAIYLAGAFRLVGWLCLSRHAREHIEYARVMQSADERSERSPFYFVNRGAT